MRKKYKKTLYSLGAITMICAPIVTIISCSNENNNNKNNKLEVNLEKTNNVYDLIQTLNKQMHFITVKPTTIIGKPVSDPSKNNNFPLTKDQYKDIANSVVTDTTFILSYGGQSKSFTTHFNKDAKIIHDVIQNDIIGNWTSKNGTNIANIMTNNIAKATSGVPNANFVGYIANMTLFVGMSGMGYLSLPDKAYNAYLDELKQWTELTWNIKTSAPYRAWEKSKNIHYISPKKTKEDIKPNKNGQIDKKYLFDPTVVTDNTKPKIPGYNMDLQNAGSIFDTPKLLQPNKVSNLGVEFDYVMQDLYSPDAVK